MYLTCSPPGAVLLPGLRIREQICDLGLPALRVRFCGGIGERELDPAAPRAALARHRGLEHEAVLPGPRLEGGICPDEIPPGIQESRVAAGGKDARMDATLAGEGGRHRDAHLDIQLPLHVDDEIANERRPGRF